MLRVTAERADVWNTIGPIVDDADEILAVTARQNKLLDQLCEANGRQPTSLRRSYTPFGPFDFWNQGMPFESLVEQFAAIGMTEFVIELPPSDRLAEFEKLATHTIPALRG